MKVEAREGKKEMERYMEIEKAYFSKIREREELRTRLEVLRLQLAEQQRLEQEGKIFAEIISQTIPNSRNLQN